MSLKLNSSGGGSVTLQEPATASALTLDLPAVNGTLLTNVSTGTILQVVQGTLTTVASTTSSTFVTTGLSVTITPRSATNKVLLSFYGMVSCTTTNDSVYLTIYRNLTDINPVGGNGGFVRYFAGNVSQGFAQPIIYLDSPSTTSATTYTVYFHTDGNTGTAYLGRIGANANTVQPSIIVAQEVVA